MSVHKKLMQARLALQNTELKKSGFNPFAKYHYFELGDFLPTVQKICNDVGICGHITFYTDIAVLSITDLDDANQFIEFKCPMSSAALKGCHEVQNMGAVLTYIRRYLWVNAFEIVEHDSLDAIKPIEKAEEVKEVKKVSEAELTVAKNNLLEARKEGKLKEAFFTLTPAVQEELREYANDLKKSA
jgi:hypothetical protein